ncbi:nucleoside phosphorylase [bacterium]|jgi:uridine phosphorylase|nr:nucleoside phosphorylase [bacterium]MDC3253439.1 nucleoside phosphorylase [bacterium]MDG1432936.1 nucleoside phosphorylase [Saprospiraceae bacterium]
MKHFPPSELIINPDGSIYHLNLKPEQIAKNIITVGDPDRVGEVSKYFDSIECKIQKREFVTHTGELNGTRISVISTGIGTDNIDIVLNELDALANIDFETRIEKEEHTSLNIIRIGTSGSMQKDIAVNTLLISEYGIGIDGLLHFYDYKNNADEHMTFLHFMETAGSEINFPIRPYIASASKKLIDTLGQNFLKGITLTCPGFYAPQGRVLRNDIAVPNLIENLRKFNHNNLQCTNFEMETAGIYGLSNVFGHQAISFNAILANRITNEFSTNPKIIIEKLIKTVLNRVSKL